MTRSTGAPGATQHILAARRLSTVVTVLMVAAAGVALVRPTVYRDNPLVTAGWMGNDVVTLAIAVPGLLVCLLIARRSSVGVGLVWMGMLAYALYNYAFYLFGAALNPLFLTYVGIVALSLLGLGFAIAGLDTSGLEGRPLSRPAARGVASFMLAVAVALGGFWLAVSLQAALTGDTPPVVAATGSHTNVVAALDLSLIAPSGILAALWLWRRQAAGFALAVIWNVQGAVYMAALTAATATSVLAGHAAPGPEGALWATIGMGCIASTWLLLRDLESARPTTGGPR